MSKKLYHGAAFYPELWDEAAFKQDITLMKEAGINVVRIGEFAWASMEPAEDHIDLSFFVQVIEHLYTNGIETVMCTPTATPPIWISHNHPERMYVNEQGITMGHGSRQHACTNNDYFQKRAYLITERIAQAVGQLPGLIGWQIDNEFKAHVSECMCKTCLTLWHQWLEEKYESIEQLNEAWGTAIWSEAYHRFDQVPQPGPAPFLHNSSLKTMYQLFSMEKIAEFSDEQASLIRRHSNAPITHNSSIAFHLDNERLFRNLDFASFDTYASQENLPAYLINCDLWRNFKRDRPFWVMETSPSYSGSLESYAIPHPDGYLKAEAVAAYALGAEAFCYWLWRQQRAGCEQPHGSVISAWGRPALGFANVLEVERARKEIEEVMLATKPSQAEVALTYSDQSKAFLKTEPLRKMSHRGLVTDYYAKLLAMGLHRDLLPEGSSLDGYKLLLTPYIHYLSPNYINRAMTFVEQGGIWIVGPLTGGRTEHHTLHTDASLGQLEKLAGVETKFTYPMDGTAAFGQAFGMSAPLGMWSSVFEAHEAATIGVINEGLTPGLAFLTERRQVNGKIVMLGSMPMGESGDRMLKQIIDHYAEESGVTIRTDVTPGTLVAPRTGDGYIVWVIINMDGFGGSVTLPEKGTDLLQGSPIEAGQLSIASYEYRIIRFNSDDTFN